MGRNFTRIARKAPSFRVGLDIGATNAHPLADPAQVQQLLQTNLCPHCDLSGANLSSATLTEADLTGVNLIGANLDDVLLSGATWTDGKAICGHGSTGWRRCETCLFPP